MIDAGRISSFILWGPPGVGKTTLAQIIANKLETPFYTLSAVTSGVKDVRDVIDRAKNNRFFSQANPILFIDEIHRFSKSQQDSLLGAVEQGIVTLIGATTENPSFEVIRPLLSRCQIYVLKSLEKEDLLELLQRALTADHILRERRIELKETTAMLRYSGGDARKLLNILELVVESETGDTVVITDDIVTERLQQNPLAYDKDGEMHYDIISAFIKSIRGSDPDGAIYLSGHQSQKQFGLHGYQRCLGAGPSDRQSACPPSSAQCPHQADEAAGLWRGLQVRPRLSGPLRPSAIPARRTERS